MTELPQIKTNDQSAPNDGKTLRRFLVKETFDKIGFGFASQQFINILMWQNGATLFLVGIINALRVVIGNITILIMNKFRSRIIGKRIISMSGIAFGFSFLLMALAMMISSVVIFSVAVLISGAAAVIYGESKSLIRLRSDNAYNIERLIKYGLFITAISLFISAFVMDLFPVSGTLFVFSIFGNTIRLDLYGYLIIFEITAISFIIAGYFLMKYGSNKPLDTKYEKVKTDYASFLRNKLLILLIVANLVIGIVQTVGFSYYGIFIFKNFNNMLFGGFLNVAMVFLISVFTSLIGYFITKMNTKVYKKFSMLVFGAVMVSAMPFFYFSMDNLVFMTMGTIIGIIGVSAFGIASSMIVIDLVSHSQRQGFFNFITILSIPFFIILAPVFAFIAQVNSLNYMFLVLSVIMLLLDITLLISAILLRKTLV